MRLSRSLLELLVLAPLTLWMKVAFGQLALVTVSASLLLVSLILLSRIWASWSEESIARLSRVIDGLVLSFMLVALGVFDALLYLWITWQTDRRSIFNRSMLPSTGVIFLGVGTFGILNGLGLRWVYMRPLTWIYSRPSIWITASFLLLISLVVWAWRESRRLPTGQAT